MFRREFGWKPRLLRCIADTDTVNPTIAAKMKLSGCGCCNVGLAATPGINSTAMAFG